MRRGNPENQEKTGKEPASRNFPANIPSAGWYGGWHSNCNRHTNRKAAVPSGGPNRSKRWRAFLLSSEKSVPPAEVIRSRSGQDCSAEAAARTKIGPRRARHHLGRGRDTPGEAGRGLPDKPASAPARAAGGRRSGYFCPECLRRIGFFHEIAVEIPKR